MRKLLAYLWLCFPYLLFADQPSYVNYTIADGLPSNTVFCSLQDSKGYLWFGTDKGVARFDGVKFSVFTTSDGMADNIVYDIFEDSKKRIWFSCNNGNACYYYDNKFWNKNSDSVLLRLNASSLGLKVLEDKYHNVYILTQFKLFKLTNQNVFSEINIKEASMFSSLTLNDLGEVLAIYSEGYYNTYNKQMGIFSKEMINKPVLNSKAFYFEGRVYYNSNACISHFNTKHVNLNLKSIPITEYPLIAQCVQITKDSTILVGTQNGLTTYSLKSNTIINKAFNGYSISSFTQDLEDNFWMTSLTNGVFLTVNSRVKLLNENSGLIFNYAGFIDKLSDGNIAIGSKKYLASFIENGKIHNLKLPRDAGEGKIEKIRVGADGNYYLTTGAVTIKVDKSNWSAKVLQISAKDIKVISPELSIMIVGSGVLVLKSSNFEELYTKKIYINNPKTGHLIQNVKANGIYVGAFSNKIYIYGLVGVKILNGENLESVLNNHEYLAKNISRVVETSDGLQCFSSNIYGVIVVYKNKIFTLNKSNGLTTNFANSIYVDNKNQLWAATSEGLSKISYKILGADLKFSIKNYTQSNGLNAKSINDITMDGETLYAATDLGVCIFTEKDLKTKTTKPTVDIESVFINEKVQNKHLNYIAKYPDNSIRVNFIGLSYSSFGNLIYKYRTKGIDNEWKYTQNTMLEYASMPYGEFDFELIALNSNNTESEVKSFHIKVIPPFWKTWWFILLLLILGFFMIFIAIKYRIKALKKDHETKEQLLHLKNKNIEVEKRQAVYEKEIIDIQNQALRLHMNPHFIFNSINSIQGFYASGDVSMAKKYIGKFSTLLRLILDQSKKDLIDINDEVKTLEYYLDLNKLRFDNKFDYEIHVDKNLLKNREEIPPMLIQPFVENSIIHGLAPLKKMGKVIVRMIDDSNYIRCEIEDNGVGREYSKILNKSKNYESTGIKVTEKRIELNNKTLEMHPHEGLIISDVINNEGLTIGTLVKFSLLKNSL